MRILFSSHVFAPSVGGLETVSAMLAGEFVRQGHEVRLVTQTEHIGPDFHEFEVNRRPSLAKTFQLLKWCDICFHNNISLPRAWPLLLVPRPWVVAHHVWIPRVGAAARLKRAALRYATGISISRAIADDLGTPSVVIPNPYDESLFRRLSGVEKDRDVIFVGRLVSDKGVDLLLSAIARLGARGLHPEVTIVGDGPEVGALQAQAASLGTSNVVFAGPRSGEELVQLLNRHRVLAIPSRWNEPFGIVALEGMACGCIPVGSAGGGLKDAIGECGETFPNGDVEALADILMRLLGDPARQIVLRERAGRHLRRHERAIVAEEYLGVLSRSLPARGVQVHG